MLLAVQAARAGRVSGPYGGWVVGVVGNDISLRDVISAWRMIYRYAV